MQITTYGRTSSPVPVIVPDPVSTPKPPVNPPTPTPPPVNPSQPTVPPNPTTLLPSMMTGMPVLAKELHPEMITVLQTAILNRTTNQWYSTQVVNGTDGKTVATGGNYDSTLVTRYDSSGKQLDTMKLWDAGHGTSVVVENYGKKNITYIWLSFANQGNTYWRFPYKKGSFKFKDIPSKTTIPKFTSAYATYHLDWEIDQLLERRDLGQQMVMYKRKISEVIKGIDHAYATVTTQAVKTKQGWATTNDSFYVLSGDTNGEYLTPADPAKLETYNWSTGTRVDTLDLSTMGAPFRDGSHEPEGLSVYRDPTTKKSSLLVGLTTGNSKNHRWYVYRFSNIGNAA